MYPMQHSYFLGMVLLALLISIVQFNSICFHQGEDMVVLMKSVLYSASSQYPDSLVLQCLLYRLCSDGLFLCISANLGLFSAVFFFS